MSLFIGSREIAPAIITQGGGSGGKQIEAVNNTDVNILKGDKVWINQENSQYKLIDFYLSDWNFLVKGTPNINNNTGIVTFSSNTSYLELNLPFHPGTKPWEVLLKVKTPSTITKQNTLWGSVTSFYKTVGGELNGNKHFCFGITSDGSTWNIGWLVGTSTVNTDTVYWLKMSYTGSDYKLEISTDGINYNLENSVTSSTPIYQGSDSIIRLGRQGSTQNNWTGSLYLLDCSITIDGQQWWTPKIIGINKNTLTGIAAENIAVGATGLVNVAK